MVVIRPILTYEYLVWWESLDRNTKSSCITIRGALCTTPTSAQGLILGLFLLDFFYRVVAAKISKRHWTTVSATEKFCGKLKLLGAVTT